MYLGCHELGYVNITTCDCRDSDRTSIRTSDVLRNVAELELIQAPNLSFIPPKSYSSLPQLKGGSLSLLSLLNTVVDIVIAAIIHNVSNRATFRHLH